MNFKPKTLMIASLAVVLTAMNASTWAQYVGKQSDSQKQSHKLERKKSQKPQTSKRAKVGEFAPGFKLKDATGKYYSLSDYKGKIVVLQWINPGCPVCKRVNSSGITFDMLKTIKGIDKDFVHLTIDSTGGAEIAKSAEYLKKYDIKSPALDDTAGKVGRMYGARTTPHM